MQDNCALQSMGQQKIMLLTLCLTVLESSSQLDNKRLFPRLVRNHYADQILQSMGQQRIIPLSLYRLKGCFQCYRFQLVRGTVKSNDLCRR